MEGRDGGDQTKPTNPKTPTKKTHNQPTSVPAPQRNPKQTKKKPRSTKSQNMLIEDNLCGIRFLKIYLVPHSGIIKCLHLDQIQSFLWETEFKYTCDTNTISG